MSRDQLVEAYVNGGISRRVFVRRLIGAGVSLAAAVSYSELLGPQWASAAEPDFYDEQDPNADLRQPKTDPPPQQTHSDGSVDAPPSESGPVVPAAFTSGLAVGRTTLSSLVSRRKLAVTLESSVPAAAVVTAVLTRPERRGAARQLTLASGRASLSGSGASTLTLALSRSAARALRGRSVANIAVSSQVTAADGRSRTDNARLTLRRRR